MEANNEDKESEDMYGELNALLNEITSGEPDASKTSPSKEPMKDSESESAHDKKSDEEEKPSVGDFVKDPVEENVSESMDEDLIDLEKTVEMKKSSIAPETTVEMEESSIDLEQTVEKGESSEKKLSDSVEDIEVDEKVLESESDVDIEQLKEELDCPNIPDDKADVLKIDNLPEIEIFESLKCDETLEELIPETRPVEENSETNSKENFIDASIETVPASEASSDLPNETKKVDQEPPSSTQDVSSSRKNSADGKDDETSNSKDNESSENLIDLLKKLSPEKLKEIQTKVFTDAKDRAQEDEQMEVDSSTSPGPIDDDVKIEKEVNMEHDDDVILIDSDDDDDPPPTIPQKLESAPKPERLSSEVVSAKRKSKLNISGETMKAPKRSKECINPDCPRDSEDFSECSKFILNFYYADKKLNRAQYVCMPCSDKAILKYEELANALLNNESMFDIELHKKHDMVEVIDSDDEDEQAEKPRVSDLEKILWNCEVESQVEDILQSLCNKVDIKQQLKWQREILEKKIDKVSKLNEDMDEELKEIERKSTRMYNELYSLNKPEIKRRPSVDITHEFEPKPSSGMPIINKVIMMPPSQVVKAVSTPPMKPIPVVMKRAVNPASLAASLKNLGVTSQPTPKFVMSPAIVPKVIPKPNVLSINSRPQPLSETPRDKVFFAVRSNVEGKMQNWAPCKLLEVLKPNNGSHAYRVQFYENSANNTLVVRGKEFALSAVNTKLKIGARVIAQFPRGTSKNKDGVKKYLPGVIGEKLSKYNNFRYLVFCDYGQVHYSSPDSVREVADASPAVWEDVHENLRQFIKDYLQSQMQRSRALLNARKNQNIQTEKNGVWVQATVVDIDCSVIKMFFPFDNSHEWLYRGSKRFGPIYIQGQRGHTSGARRLYNDPNITYITIDDDSEQSEQSTSESAEPEVRVNRVNTAKKSTAPPPPKPAQQTVAVQPAASSSGAQQKVIILNDLQNYLFEPLAVLKQRHFTPRKDIAAKRYEAHKCSPKCLLRQTTNLNNYSPLTKPLLTCWERQIVRQKNLRWVLYKAPCGRRLRNMDEIRTYLILTRCGLNVDNFDFDTQMQVLSQYDVPDKTKCPLYIPDMSEGKEGMKIPIINPFDTQRPPDLVYSPHRIPMPGVNINTDPEFMACCDCTDDCADKTKCACFQMTIRGYKYAHADEDWNDLDVSYVWKRLLHPVTTGIYECNSRCKCSSRCLNKVVQQPIQIKMHLIRTANRGWGLECAHDIPKGTFVSIYAGRLYREEDANELCQGLDHGDEYFAELDLIETATPLKEGYEPGVIYDSDTEEEKASDSDSDYDATRAEEDVDFNTKSRSAGNREILTRSARIEKSQKSGPDRQNSTDSGSDGDIVTMEPRAGNDTGAVSKALSLRKLYGKNEKPYVMDAKKCGNVGRYFNHSCDPNLFVQSVFVDTHDMRFPWIAFFATCAIKAGSELTWNYNYEVGSVASKVLYCKCGAKNCRGRIL